MPLLAALMVWWRPSAPTLAIPAPARPALVFRQYTIDLGKVKPESEIRGTFFFENRSSKPVTIDGVTPSCSCLQPRLEKKTYQPGEPGRIVLRIQPANESPGKKELFADVTYHDPEPRQTRLTFKLDLPAQQLVVRPSALIFYQFSGTPTSQLLTIRDHRGKAIRVGNLSVTSDLVTAELGDSSRTPEGIPEQQIRVTVAADCPPERQHVLLNIELHDPDTPVLRVPLIIQGKPVAQEASPAAEATSP